MVADGVEIPVTITKNRKTQNKNKHHIAKAHVYKNKKDAKCWGSQKKFK